MSRSGYSDDLDTLELGRWRGRVASAIRGKRGQKLLREMAEALDAMPERVLISSELESEGEHCALGVVGAARGLNMQVVDPEDPHQVASLFDIAAPLAQEVVYINDECGFWRDTPEDRWNRVRKWVADHLKLVEPSGL